MRVRWADGEPHPEPKAWKRGVCLKCQKEADKSKNRGGGETSAQRKRPKFGGRKKGSGKVHPPLTEEQRALAIEMMRAGESNGRVTDALGVHHSLVPTLRTAEGIPHPNVVRRELAAAAAA